MDKEKFLKLNKKIDNNFNKLFIMPGIIVFSLLSFNYLIFLSSDLFKINEHIVLVVLLTLMMSTQFFILFKVLNKNKKLTNERDSWLIKNEKYLIEEESVFHKYEIIDFIYLTNNLNNKMNVKKTKLFNHDTDLIEIIYIKNNQKHKLITEASVLNQNPKHISYIEFDDKGTFYKNGIYNLVCE